MEKHNFYQENHAATAIDTIAIAIAMKPIESHPSRLPGELLHGSFFGVELEKYDIAERRCDNATFKIGRHFWNRAWETSIFDEQQNWTET